MRTKLWAILLMVVCTAFTSIAQLFYKAGAAKLSFDVVALITNWQVITGMALYAMGAVLMITAFRGGEVSVLYPIIATSYIWVSLLSWTLFNEGMNAFRWAGVALIFFGVVMISMGSTEKEPAIEYTEVV